jgi:hypothetical protein
LERMLKAIELNFGYRKYPCLGRPVAMLELNKVIFEVSSDEANGNE